MLMECRELICDVVAEDDVQRSGDEHVDDREVVAENPVTRCDLLFEHVRAFEKSAASASPSPLWRLRIQRPTAGSSSVVANDSH